MKQEKNIKAFIFSPKNCLKNTELINDQQAAKKAMCTRKTKILIQLNTDLDLQIRSYRKTSVSKSTTW